MTRAPRSGTFVLLDTSVYLHCRLFVEVDWHRVVGRPAVTLFVPGQVFREIDKQKDQARVRSIQNRARLAAARLTEVLKAGSEAALRPGVRLLYQRKAPPPEVYSQYDLDASIPDEQILAAALAFRLENPEAEVVVVTRDGPMTVHAGEVGFEVVPVPEELVHAPDPDPVEQELRQARQELQRLRARLPALRLTFATGSDHLHCSVARVASLTPEAIAARVDQAAGEYPPSARLRSLLAQSAIWDRDDVRRYDNDRLTYLANLRDYLPVEQAWREYQTRIVQPVLRLENIGSAPATDVTLRLWAPAGMTATLERMLPTAPSEPETPPLPQADSSADLILRAMRGGPAPLERRHFAFGPSEEQRDRVTSSHYGYPSLSLGWGPEAETLADGQTQVRYTWKKLQQGHTEPITDLVVVLPSYDAIRPFALNYELRADELPEPLTGELHVVARVDAATSNRAEKDAAEKEAEALAMLLERLEDGSGARGEADEN